MPLLVIQTIHRGCKGSDDIVSSNTSISIGIQKPTTVCSFNSKHILTTQHDIISSRDSQPQSSTECITKPFSQQFPSRVFQRHSRPSVWCLFHRPTPYMLCTHVLEVTQNYTDQTTRDSSSVAQVQQSLLSAHACHSATSATADTFVC